MKINVGQILSESVSFYKGYFNKLVVISLSVSLVSFLVTAYTHITGYAQTKFNDTPLMLLLFSLMMLVIMIFALVIMTKVSLAMPILINALFDKSNMTAREAFQQTRGKFWRLVGYSLVVGMLYFPFSVIIFTKIPFASAIGTIYTAFISSMFYTLFPMIAIEAKTTSYLGKSVKMIKGNYIPVLILTFVTVTTLSVINSVLTYVFQGKTTELFMIGIVYAIAYFFVYPFAGVTTVIVYRRLKSSNIKD